MFFIKNSKGEWWELNKEKMTVYNFDGGSHSIAMQDLKLSEVVKCDGWNELYKIKKWCPLEVNVNWIDVWVSPEGKFYNGEAHENRAEEILEIIYGEIDVDWAGDKLEELGWVRATTSLMWEVRADSDYWNNRKLSQKQYDALWDWCKIHNKKFPRNVEVN